MTDLCKLDRLSGQHRIVWECLYAYDMYHRVDDGMGDTRPAGKTRERNTWHTIAPTLAFAKAAWQHHHPEKSGYELVSCEPLCVINNEVTV